MKLRLGISPCPNDTFIFDALLHQKIDTEGLEFDVSFADVEQLNIWALEKKLDVTKISFNAFTQCFTQYVLLDSGAALGRNCGPLLIKKPEKILTSLSRIGMPGKYTTANLLLSVFQPTYNNKFELIFSDIENQILLNKIDAGVIIHENRFTYDIKGLEKVIDLGEFWEQKTGLPIPLGGIVIDRDFSYNLKKRFERVLRKSVEYAFANRESSLSFVRCHAQEMESKVVRSHIDLYVNDYTISLADVGREAVKILFEKTGTPTENIFL